MDKLAVLTNTKALPPYHSLGLWYSIDFLTQNSIREEKFVSCFHLQSKLNFCFNQTPANEESKQIQAKYDVFGPTVFSIRMMEVKFSAILDKFLTNLAHFLLRTGFVNLNKNALILRLLMTR